MPSLGAFAPEIWQSHGTLGTWVYVAANLNRHLWGWRRPATCFFSSLMVRYVSWPPHGVCNLASQHGVARPGAV